MPVLYDSMCSEIHAQRRRVQDVYIERVKEISNDVAMIKITRIRRQQLRAFLNQELQ